MAKLFVATEDTDLINGAQELQVSPEEGELSTIQAEAEAEASGITQDADNLDAGADASLQMEQVEAVVEKSVEQGEGLDPVAAESLRVAMRVICRSVGANPQGLYQRYSAENFTAGNRVASSTYALEGVQEFLKDLWKKVKAALAQMSGKLKSFWAKHVSSSGRILKAVTSMKNRVRSSSGKISGKAYLEKAPAAVASYFKTTKDINVSTVRKAIFDPAVLEVWASNIQKFATDIASVAGSNNSDAKKAAVALAAAFEGVKKADFNIPVVGGEQIVVEIEPDIEEGTIRTSFTREPNGEVEESPSMAVADKGALTSLLGEIETLIKAVVKSQNNSEKLNQKYQEALNNVEKLLGNADLQGLASQNARKCMRLVYKMAAVNAKVETMLINESIRTTKAVLTFTSTCLKQYS